MRFERVFQIAVVSFLELAATAPLSAQVTFVTTPSSVTVGPGADTQNVNVTTSTGQQAVTVVTCPPIVFCTIGGNANLGRATPFTLTVTGNPSAGTASASITFSGVGLSTLSIPVNSTYPASGGGTGGTAAFSAAPSSLVFNQSETQTIAISSNTGSTPLYTASVGYQTGSGWLTVTPALGQISSSSVVSVTASTAGLALGTYSATLTLTSSSVAAPAIAIPITLNVTTGGGSGNTLGVSPNPVVFAFPVGTTTAQVQFLTVTSAVPGVTYTTSLSANLFAFVTVAGSGVTNNTLQLTIPSPQTVTTGVTGSITLTPAGGVLSPITVPIQINSSTTPGSLVVIPTSLSFTSVVGTAQVPAQSLSVSSADSSTQFFNVSATSTNNFLTVTPQTGTTPATLQVGVNMAGITTPGTYTGQIVLTSIATNIQTVVNVTLTATSAITVTADVNPVVFTAATGSTTQQQRSVQLSTSNAGTVFTATAVTSSGGNWLSVQANSPVLATVITVLANPTGLIAGTYSGRIDIATSGVNIFSLPVTLTVVVSGALTVTPATLTFNYQAIAGVTPPPPQALSITSDAPQGLSWTATVNAANGGTWLQIAPANGTTPTQASVSVGPTALAPGTYNGTITIASTGATNSPQTVNVVLNVSAASVPAVTAVVNAASFGPTQAVPGLIVTIFGRDLGPSTLTSGQVTGNQLNTTVGMTRVLFDNIPAPILYTSATQVSAVVPYEIANRVSTRMVVEYNGQTSSAIDLRVGETAPALFTAAASGLGQAAALNETSGVNAPGNPESRGRVIVLYGTGEGQTNPTGQTGRIVQPVVSDLRRPLAPVSVRFGDVVGGTAVAGQVEYVGSAPGFVSGAMQINVRIPTNAPTGSAVPVTLTIGSASSQPSVTVAIQ